MDLNEEKTKERKGNRGPAMMLIFGTMSKLSAVPTDLSVLLSRKRKIICANSTKPHAKKYNKPTEFVIIFPYPKPLLL